MAGPPDPPNGPCTGLDLLPTTDSDGRMFFRDLSPVLTPLPETVYEDVINLVHHHRPAHGPALGPRLPHTKPDRVALTNALLPSHECIQGDQDPGERSRRIQKRLTEAEKSNLPVLKIRVYTLQGTSQNLRHLDSNNKESDRNATDYLATSTLRSF